MAHIPANYLSRKGGAWRTVRLIDLVTLMYNLRRGAQHPEVGFEDVNFTLDEVTKALNKTIQIDPRFIESALWAANLLNERGEFSDCKSRDFDQFVWDLLGSKDEFNKIYNWIGKKGEDK